MRKLVTGFGIILFALFIAFSVWGEPFSDPAFALQVLSFGLAGVLFLIGGLIDGFSVGDRRIQWYVFFGLGIAMVGVSFSLGIFIDSQLDSSAGQVFMRIVAVANALVFGYMGFDAIRGNTYVDSLKPS